MTYDFQLCPVVVHLNRASGLLRLTLIWTRPLQITKGRLGLYALSVSLLPKPQLAIFGQRLWRDLDQLFRINEQDFALYALDTPAQTWLAP